MSERTNARIDAKQTDRHSAKDEEEEGRALSLASTEQQEKEAVAIFVTAPLFELVFSYFSFFPTLFPFPVMTPGWKAMLLLLLLHPSFVSWEKALLRRK